MRSLLVAMSVTCALAFASAAHATNVSGSWSWTGAKTDADSKAVESAIKGIEGVSRATVTKTSIQLTYDNAKVDEAKISSAVSSAGAFHLNPKKTPSAHKKGGNDK